MGSGLFGKFVLETQHQTFMTLGVTIVHDCLFKIFAGSFVSKYTGAYSNVLNSRLPY